MRDLFLDWFEFVFSRWKIPGNGKDHGVLARW